MVTPKGTAVFRCNNINPYVASFGLAQGQLTLAPQYCWPFDRFTDMNTATDTLLRVAPGVAPAAPFGPGSTPVFACNNPSPRPNYGYPQFALTTKEQFCIQFPAPAATDTLLRVAPGSATSSLTGSGPIPVFTCNNFSTTTGTFGQGISNTDSGHCFPFPPPAVTDTLLRVQ
jgi:hypothetical protein